MVVGVLRVGRAGCSHDAAWTHAAAAPPAALLLSPQNTAAATTNKQNQTQTKKGLGALSALSDELLLAVLYQLPARSLTRLALASRAAYAYGHHAELWKALLLEVCFAGCVVCLLCRATRIHHHRN